MKIGNQYVQFKLNSKYKTIDDVPHWRVYLIKQTKYEEKGQTHTRNEPVLAIGNYTFDELKDKLLERPKGHVWVAYPRKSGKLKLKVF